MSEPYFVPHFEPLNDKRMWVGMILKIFKSTTDLSNPKEYFRYQFNARKEQFQNQEIYFYQKCKENVLDIKEAFKFLIDNECQLPMEYSEIVKQVFECDVVFSSNENSEKWSFDKKIALKDEKDFDKLLNEIEELITLDIKNASESLKEGKTREKVNSFRYKKFDSSYSNLSDLMRSLREKGLISNDTKLKDFRKIFSGNSIGKPIIWTGNVTELSYFIRQLHTYLNLVEDLKHKIWDVTMNCFVDENSQQFKRSSLKGASKPESLTSKDKVESAVKTLL
jgi:hypothetical protein